ncbi:MAG: sugar transferase [Flavobacteriales bacterium]|jgi:lipopolysaccharide/colanic/teichoic acid biosynthesis glycosyltransferase|nr:sugar transferase [Flavobacteriales bacterium]
MAKRLFDILAAATALLLLSPVLLTIALLVGLGSPGGVFFRQERVGRGGRTFRLWKFRTMRPGSERQGQLTVGGRDPRITATGRWLRKSKLDELPQLVNVLVGHMSIVGPRPEVPKYVALYTPEQRAVLQVRPGITGAASIAYIDENELLGRSTDPERTYVQEVMPAKLALDLAYVRDTTPAKDLRIIWRTLRRLLGPRG